MTAKVGQVGNAYKPRLSVVRGYELRHYDVGMP